MARKIDKKAEGKHVGHACEGHFRGITERAIEGSGLKLVRQLPFQFHVNPDVVVLDQNERVHTVVLVAFWNDSKSSEKKFYRCRSEYFGIKAAISKHPEKFVDEPVIAVFLYGARDGWKDQILADLKHQCSPCFYLPHVLSNEGAEALSNLAFSIYKPHWESGKSASRIHVENFTTKKKTLSTEEEILLTLVRGFVFREPSLVEATSVAAVDTTSQIRLPKNHFNTRYRQALGPLAVFPDNEIAVGKAVASLVQCPATLKDYVIRAHFLGLGSIRERKSLGQKVLVFDPALPLRDVKGALQYAPDLADFKNWEEIPDATRLKILGDHRDRTRNPGTVFKGGAFDQCIGNYREICGEFERDLPALLDALKNRRKNELAKILSQARPVGPEAWHPARGNARFYPIWALAATTLACCEDDRSVRSNFSARSQSEPTSLACSKLAAELISQKNAKRLLEECLPYCRSLLSQDLNTIRNTPVPTVLSSENPSSLIKDFYNTLTTNSSHNPLAGPVKEWLETKYAGYEWHGWPNKRSARISDVLGVKVGRRQWQFIGISADGKSIVAAEVKSITANNWGNKSKELYDRVAETRTAAQTAKIDLRCVGVLDGDFGSEQFAELATGIGYDEMYSIKEVLGIP